jgi:twitching motility two-component system response regulator PilG
MVVDDSPTVRKLVSLTLERRGYRVISAFDGVAAIKELGSNRPDLILLDINMPRLDGYRLCKLIKKHEATQSIPVVMLSGKDGMFDKLRGRLVGCSDYITKPFEADALTVKVAKYLAPAVASSL